jgi:uncharacterized protein (TIGR03435 family)
MRTLLLALALQAIGGNLPPFDVASVTPADADARGVGPATYGPGRWSARNATLESLISSVYPDFSRPELIVGGPPWLRSARFNVDARTDADRTPRELRAMAQALLVDRFALQTHLEIRRMPVFDLVKARPDGRLGPGLTAATDCQPPACAPPRAAAGGDNPSVVIDTSIDIFARLIARCAGGVVRDRTGLGARQFRIRLAFDCDAGSPAVSTALREQLGLALEANTELADVLVVDSAERP